MSVGAKSNYNNDDNDKPSEKKVPLREMAKYLDILMGFVEDHSESHITSLYYLFCQLKDFVVDLLYKGSAICKQRWTRSSN